MSDRTATLTAVLVDAVSGTAKKIQGEITNIGTTTSRMASILQGIGQGIGQQAFFAIERAISSVIDIIPNLLERGNSYLDQLHQIQLETGMTAEQTSTLVGALRAMGVPTSDLDTLFARLGKNLASNEGLFRQLGVATRDSNGALLSSYTIFQNIRGAVAAHGESLLTTAAAQELFGRSGFKLIEALQASDPEWKAATDNVRRWGGVVSQAAIDGADRLGDTLSSLQQGITDIGVNIAAAVDPFLRAFVDSFASFVQAHLNEIVNFAVAVVNTVTGFISGLFGITNALNVSSGAVSGGTAHASAATSEFGKTLKGASAGSDAFTKSIEAQIKAIDAHAHAIEQAAERRRAVQERARLTDSLAAAQAQLADLKGNSPFLGGLSAAEQALAVQKHAQDIIDAEKDVRDKRQALGDFEADQKDRAERELLNRQKARLQERLAASKAADAAMLTSGLRMGEGLDTNLTTVLGNLGVKTEEFGKTASASFQTGIDAANSFLDILLGAEHAATDRGEGTFRTGGVIGALHGVGDAFNGLVGAIGPLWQLVQDIAGAFNDMGRQLDFLGQSLSNLGADIHNFFVDVINGLRGGNVGHDPVGDFFFGGPPGASGFFIPKQPGGARITAGEGSEDEILLPLSAAPRLGLGGGITINMTNEFLSMPTDEQLRTLTDKISKRLAFNLSNTGATSRPSGAF